jgi:hypothetical protein
MVNFFSFSCIVLVLLGCSADRNAKKSDANESLFLINSERDTILYCKLGTKIILPKRAFDIKEDSSLIKPNLWLSVREFYKKSDMVLEGLTTRSDGDILVSGGMLNISASMNGDTLRLLKNIAIEFNKDTWRGHQFFPYVGEGALENLNWVKKDDLSLDGPFMDSVWEDSSTMHVIRTWILEESVFRGTAMNWINADIPMDEWAGSKNLRKTRIVVAFESHAPKRAYLVFNNVNSILPGKEIGKGVFSFENIPDSMKVTVVGFTKTNDHYNFALREIVSRSDTIYLKMSKSNLDLIKESLKVLDKQ